LSFFVEIKCVLAFQMNGQGGNAQDLKTLI
jgi:hypothetical protein